MTTSFGCLSYSFDFFGGFREGMGSVLGFHGVVVVVVGPGVGLVGQENGVDGIMNLVVEVVDVWFSAQQTLKTIFMLCVRHRPPTLL